MKTRSIKNLWPVQMLTVFLILLFCTEVSLAQKILIFMDDKQTDHLRAYGLAYWTLQRGLHGEWLLNYRGGSFLLPDDPSIPGEAAGMPGTANPAMAASRGWLTAAVQSWWQRMPSTSWGGKSHFEATRAPT